MEKNVNHVAEVEVTGGYHYPHPKRAGYNLSWGAVIAGVVTFIALLITFSLVSSALGFGQITPTDPNPFEGVGTGQAIWWVIALVLSFLGAGFVSGVAARRVGTVHGFLTWASSLIASVVLIGWLASSVVSTVGNVAGTVIDGAATAVGGVAETAGSAISDGVSALVSDIDINQEDIDNLGATVTDVLEDTDIPELQPEYLQNELNAAGDEIAAAAQELVVNPENSETILNDLSTSLQARIDNIAENVDEEALANAIEENTDLNQTEAEEATQNIIDAYNTAATEARKQIQATIDNLETAVADLQVTAEEVVDDALETTEEVTDTISTASIWAFVGVIVGAILSALAGKWGVNFAHSRVDEEAI